MFNLKNPFKSTRDAQGLSSLNLDPNSSYRASATMEQPKSSLEEQMAVIRSRPVPEEINRGIQQLLDSGRHPEAVFFAGNPQTGALLVFRNHSPALQAILLFSSPQRAKDYLKATNTPGDMQVLGVNFDSLPMAAEHWRASGVDSFIINRCPRCPFVQPVKSENNLITKQQLTFMWATNMTIHNWQAAKLLRQYLAYKGEDMLSQKRATLEILRDHVAYDVPYVHWLIALIAGVQGDENTRAAALACLMDFGPDVASQMSVTEGNVDDKAWTEAMAKAHVGLFASFGLLNTQQGQPTG